MAKLMVVDDSPDIVKLYSMILEKRGYEVISAESGEEALRMLESGEMPDLILLDITMPGINGWEVCKYIKRNKKTKDITVIMLAVNPEADGIKKSFEYAKADGHIDKLRSADIVDVVGNALGEEIGGEHEIF
ncbi:response regulator [archaeon]|nr:response regulator [archaeon]